MRSSLPLLGPSLYNGDTCTAWAKPRPSLAWAAHGGRKGGWSGFLGRKPCVTAPCFISWLNALCVWQGTRDSRQTWDVKEGEFHCPSSHLPCLDCLFPNFQENSSRPSPVGLGNQLAWLWPCSEDRQKPP